jgi:hypothetical protein
MLLVGFRKFKLLSEDFSTQATILYQSHNGLFTASFFKIVKQREGEHTFYLNNGGDILAEAFKEGKR